MQRIVEQQMTHLSRLLDHLIDAVNFDTREFEIQHHHPVDMAQVIDAAVTAYLPTINERR